MEHPTPKNSPLGIEQFITAVRALRKDLKLIAETVWLLRYPETQNPEHVGRLPEMSANVSLAYRHLEDASIRLGKAIQAADGAQSVYDKTESAGATPEPGAGTVAAASALSAAAGIAGLI